MSKYSTAHGVTREPGELAVSDRKPVNKKRSAAEFRRSVGKTKAANIAPASARGGFRL